jgi:hypothetical protein
MRASVESSWSVSAQFSHIRDWPAEQRLTLAFMETLQDRLALWTLAVELGVGTFIVRRTLDRIERGELIVSEAVSATGKTHYTVGTMCDGPCHGMALRSVCTA